VEGKAFGVERGTMAVARQLANGRRGGQNMLDAALWVSGSLYYS